VQPKLISKGIKLKRLSLRQRCSLRVSLGDRSVNWDLDQVTWSKVVYMLPSLKFKILRADPLGDSLQFSLIAINWVPQKNLGRKNLIKSTKIRQTFSNPLQSSPETSSFAFKLKKSQKKWILKISFSIIHLHFINI
jgi:hypothetical protein